MTNLNKEISIIKEIKTRSISLNKSFLFKPIKIYNGKTYITKYMEKNMLFKPLGLFVLTKKIGRNIHDSERNRKRKNKKKTKK